MRHLLYLLFFAPFLTDWIEDGRPPGTPRELVSDIAVGLLIAVGVTVLLAQRDDLERLAMTDALTGLGNFRAFGEALKAEAARARRQGEPMALAYIDLDNFKSVNDRFGHEAGNTLLRRFATSIGESVRRDVDRAYRIGGDEFAVLLPGASLDAAREVAARLRKHATEPPAMLQEFGVTLSVGIAALRPDEPVELFLKRADALALESKSQGKNRITEAA